MKEVIRLVKDDLKKGVTNERFLFALVLLFEWHKGHASIMKTIQD